MAFLAGLAARLAPTVLSGLRTAATSETFKKAGGKAFEIIGGAAAGAAFTKLFNGSKTSITKNEFIDAIKNSSPNKQFMQSEIKLMSDMFDQKAGSSKTLSKEQVNSLVNEMQGKDQKFDASDTKRIQNALVPATNALPGN